VEEDAAEENDDRAAEAADGAMTEDGDAGG
jgi:hypothetical protein